MRVRVCLDFDISKALGVSYTSVHRIMNDKRPCKSNRPKERAEILDDFDHCVIKRTMHGLYSRKIAPTVSITHQEAFSLLKMANNFFTIVWHSGDKSDFLPILQKMQYITIIYERNACQVRLKYTWLRKRFYR
jgi:hypothetical protein